MKVADLTRDEQFVLVGLARHLVGIDGTMSDSELFDLLRLGVEIGRDTFAAALEATEATHHDAEAVLASAVALTRPEARLGIARELERIAAGDGIHDGEASFLAELRSRWG